LFRRSKGAVRAASSITPTWDDRAAFQESFRLLRSNLEVALEDVARPTLIVTSAHANEGKTLTAANLAVTFASAGKRVILVDLDLRHPNAHLLVGGHNEFGACEVLLRRRALADAIQFVELPGGEGRGMYFLATGQQVANPAELLGGGRTSKLLAGLSAQADLVILDTPPVLPVADTLVVGRIASGAVLVTEARRTALAAVNTAKDRLIRNQTRILGVVVNKFQERDAFGSFAYGYGYGKLLDSTTIGPDYEAGTEIGEGEKLPSLTTNANGAEGLPFSDDRED
jgi:capsular exopolysaccharide synthesis family protein